MIREEPVLLTDIRDFTRQLYVIFETQVLRIVTVVYRECPSHAICSLDLAIRDFASYKHCFYFLIFVIRENEIFLSVNRDPLYFRFVNRARDFPVRPS